MEARWYTYLGWLATAVFVVSYFSKRASTLRRIQMLGAALWIVYGSLIHAAPVMVANALVLAAAAWSEVRAARARRNARSSDANG